MISKSLLRLSAGLFCGSLVGLEAADSDALIQILAQNGVLSAADLEALETASDQEARLIQILVQNGALTADQAASLTPAPAAATVAPSSAPAPKTTAAAPKPVVRAKEKSVETLTISGRVQAQVDYLRTDYDDAEAPEDAFNLFVRRLYLGAAAQFNDRIGGSINANFANDAEGVAELEKAIVEYAWSDSSALQVGYQKVPFGYEETRSSSKIWSVERSVTTRYFTEQLDLGSRHVGLFFEGTTESGISGELALTKPEQGGVSSSAESNALAAWGRLEWKGQLGSFDVIAGVNGGIIPEARDGSATDLVYGGYVLTSLDTIRFEAELLAATLEGADAGIDAHPWGLNFSTQWDFAESLDLVARVSYLSSDHGIGPDISSTSRKAPENGSALYDTTRSFYLGGNWKLHGNALKLSAGYEWTLYSDNLTGAQGDAQVDGLRTRLQFCF